jgi:hypothetical protein
MGVRLLFFGKFTLALTEQASEARMRYRRVRRAIAAEAASMPHLRPQAFRLPGAVFGNDPRRRPS